MSNYDAIIIGSGPNGLAAGITLAQKNLQVLILEAHEEIGGGTRTAELTLKDFQHDVCATAHPTGFFSPFFQQLPLEKYGLEWVFPPVSLAHPLDGEPAVLLKTSIAETAQNLGKDAKAWEKLFAPFEHHIQDLIDFSFHPLGFPKKPFLTAQFGMKAFQSAQSLAQRTFAGSRAKALFAGCAAHSIMPLNASFTAGMGMVFAMMGHGVNWPFVKGGSHQLTKCLAQYFTDLGGRIQTQTRIRNFKELPTAKAYLFDTDPRQLASIASQELPLNYRNKLEQFYYGPGIFKIDWALDQAVPWKDKNCLQAGTIHIGGTLEEIAYGEKTIWEGHHAEKPFVLFCQPSLFDTRAPQGKHIGWAYCHVPFQSTKDMTELIENQIERFAPGFKDTILSRHIMNTQHLHDYNPNYVGGVITGGATTLSQLFRRPVARWNAYTTPHDQIFICSASTPPGGGVHGMCGYNAAQTVWRKIFK